MAKWNKSYTNSELSRMQNNVRRRVKRIKANKSANHWGADKYLDFESRLKQLGGWRNIKDPFARSAMVAEFRTLANYKSTSMATAKKQAKQSINLFGKKQWESFSDREKTAVWNEIAKESERNKDWDSDQVQNAVAEKIKDGSIRVKFIEDRDGSLLVKFDRRQRNALERAEKRGRDLGMRIHEEREAGEEMEDLF